MRTVKLIKDVVIEEVPYTSDVIIMNDFQRNWKPIHSGEGVIYPQEPIQQRVVPIEKFHWNVSIRNYVDEIDFMRRFPEGTVYESLCGTCKTGVHEELIAVGLPNTTVLGTYIEAMSESLRKEKEVCYERGHEIRQFELKLNRVNKASFWKRLKYLFTGRFDWEVM